ncbi:MAG: iron-containing alcohol dehydrogenase [Candidatus Treponema excrementipullorum]|nr:iron-containing alcohol dehydrogenase [Candidatus Treponema excrementipullorum]
MADLNFTISPNIILGAYASFRLGLAAKNWGNRYMVIVDPILKEIAKLDTIFNSLTTRGVNYIVFDRITSGPDSETIQDALQLARKSYIQGVIAIGGSSIQSIGRVVSSLYNETKSIYNYIDGDVPETEPLPFISIPSKAISEFGFSDNVPIVDARIRQCRILKINADVCKLAVFDASLPTFLPPNQSGAVSLEILCLACEAYLSQKASFFSDMFAEKTFSLLNGYLDSPEKSISLGSHEDLLSQVGCLASLATGLASIGPASLLALTIRTQYGIPRSLTTAIILPCMLEDLRSYKAEKIATISKQLGFAEQTSDTEEAITRLIEGIRQKMALMKLPTRLKELSLSMEELTVAVEDAGQLELINNMPRSMATGDLFTLMKSSF